MVVIALFWSVLRFVGLGCCITGVWFLFVGSFVCLGFGDCEFGVVSFRGVLVMFSCYVGLLLIFVFGYWLCV